MRLLLDTHAFLWFCEGNPALSRRARAAIEEPGNQCYVSVVSLWEIAIKSSLGKLTLRVPFSDLVSRQLHESAVELLPLEPAHLVRLHVLPPHHKDPFDRVLVAQALFERLELVSRDPRLDAYGVQRLW